MISMEILRLEARGMLRRLVLGLGVKRTPPQIRLIDGFAFVGSNAALLGGRPPTAAEGRLGSVLKCGNFAHFTSTWGKSKKKK